MRKLLNTIYVTNEQAYLSLDGNNLVCLLDEDVKFRIPFDNVEGIVCFGYRGCSPALMGKCVESQISLSFISPQGKFLAKVTGETRGNVFLRVAQIDVFREKSLELAKNSMAAKISNCISVIRRSRHDMPALREDQAISDVVDELRLEIDKILNASSLEEILGIEGYCASLYFGIFGKLFTSKAIVFTLRSKRPPLDPINAVLSFCILYIQMNLQQHWRQ